MKLSEAIREGSKKHPQAAGDMFDYDECDNIIGSCALGAAIVAIKPDVSIDTDDKYDLLRSQYTDLAVTRLDPPEKVKTTFKRSIEDMVIYLNDIEEWTREDIADWLESQGL